MTEAELYAKVDEVIGPYLSSKGFRREQPAEYLRSSDDGGEVRVMVSKGPPSRAERDFAVFLSYYPRYLDPLKELYGWTGGDRGFPCGPYLNPVSVGSRPKYWSYKDMATLSMSLKQVLGCLEGVGLPWLASLRDPKIFATNVDPMAAIGAALANEAAGDRASARKFYEEMMRRFLIMLKDFGESTLLKHDGKAFVFVAKKLNIEKDLCERFEQKLNYRPSIEPL